MSALIPIVSICRLLRQQELYYKKTIRMQDKNKAIPLFSVRLTSAMKNKSFNQSSLAAATKIHQTSISEYINGKSIPSSAALSTIAEVLGVSMDYLWGRTEQENASLTYNESIATSKTTNGEHLATSAAPLQFSTRSEQFSHRLSLAMKRLGITQRDLAKQINIREQTLSRYKSGTRIPDTEELHRLAKFLGVTMEWLMGGSESTGESIWKKRAMEAESKLYEFRAVTDKLNEITQKLSKLTSD